MKEIFLIILHRGHLIKPSYAISFDFTKQSSLTKIERLPQSDRIKIAITLHLLTLFSPSSVHCNYYGHIRLMIDAIIMVYSKQSECTIIILFVLLYVYRLRNQINSSPAT